MKAKSSVIYEIIISVLVVFLFANTTDNSYIHSYSGTYFPEKIGSLTKGSVTEYDNTGKNISVAYSNQNMELTHYVYPAYTAKGNYIPFDKHFFAYIDAIKKAYQDVEMIEDIIVTIGKNTGRLALFQFTTNFNFTEQEVFSYFYLFKDKGWFIKLRITFPKSQAESCQLDIDEYLNSLPMPTKHYE